MASPWKLPQELTDQVVQLCFDHLLRNLPEMKKLCEKETLEFLALRRVCHSLNAAVENILLRLETVRIYTDYYAPLARLMLLHVIRRGKTGKYPMVSTIKTSGDLILSGMGITNVTPRTQDWVWKTICLSLTDGATWVLLGDFCSKVYAGPIEAKVSYAIAIRAAAYEGNVSLLETLLDQKPDAFSVTITPFSVPASIEDSLDMVELDHPILTAARRGNLGAVKVLAERHSGIDFGGVTDRNRNTALHFAAASGSLPLFDFCAHDLRINRRCRNATQTTPLDIAASLGRMAIVEAICKRHNEAYMKLTSHEKINCGVWYEIGSMESVAAEYGQIAVLECTFTHAKDIVKDLLDQNKVRIAVRSGDMDAVRMIMHDSIVSDPDTLAKAAFDGLTESIRCENMEALGYFISIDYPSWDLRTGNNDDALEVIFHYSSANVIRYVANHPALQGSPALHHAMEILVYRGRTDLVEMILAQPGVDINWRNHRDESMLFIARGMG